MLDATGNAEILSNYHFLKENDSFKFLKNNRKFIGNIFGGIANTTGKYDLKIMLLTRP